MKLNNSLDGNPKRLALMLGKCLFLLMIPFSSVSLGQVIGPVGHLPVQVTEFYKSANQPDLRQKLSAPSALAVTRFGSLYVFDDGNARIVKIDKDGEFLSEFGSRGTLDSRISPAGLSGLIALDKAENVYVADTVKSKVLIFNKNGKFLMSFRVPFLIEGLTVNNLEEIFVSVTATKTIPLIYVFSTSGKLIRSFGERIVTQQGELPKQVNRALIASDSAGDVFVVFRHWPLIRRYSRFGKLLGETSFKVPSEIVPESQRERYSLSFIARNPDTDYSLPLLAHSISVNQKGNIYVLLNGHSVVKFTSALQLIKIGHLKIPNLPRETTLVRLAAATDPNKVFLLDIRSSSIFSARGLD